MSWNITQQQREHVGLDGVIFDLDGVLVTTDHFHFKAWRRLAEELGMEHTEENNHQLRGISRVESLKIIYRNNNRELPPREEFEAQMTRKNGYYKDYISEMTPDDVLPGSLELLNALRDAGIKIATASSSKNAGLVLERTRLIDYMDAVADGTAITKSKPDRQVFQLAALRLHCMPWNCIGVEDAVAGVESIQRAGMIAVGIGEQGKEAELVIDSVQDLSREKLHDLYNSTPNRRTAEAEAAFDTVKEELGE